MKMKLRKELDRPKLWFPYWIEEILKVLQCYEQAKVILAAADRWKEKDFCGFLMKKLFVLEEVMKAFWIDCFLTTETEVTAIFPLLILKFIFILR
jgi:phenolic acid decarboxylase